ncbi:LTA synthase family protein [Buttiauxella agrestis]|uniref:LTA synthase family protein n=1 Tax=Buttiauxella agrestis TaxID=82977 RepID=UPI001FF099BD|nr:LTA synthase family protein [Buttiauxella agrestis]
MSLSGRLDLLFWIYLESSIIYFFILSSNLKFKGVIWFTYNALLGVQVASVYSSGYYILPLTLSNASEYSALGINAIAKLSFIVFAFVFSSLFIRMVKSKPRKKSIKILGASIIAVIIIMLPVPLHAIANTISSYYSQITYKPDYNYPEYAKKYLKASVWNEGPITSLLNKDTKNVIVIFTEGMSSSIIDKVNNQQLNITPNIDALYDSSIVFENYYNHTAATFRGLRGQLTSAYQYKDGNNSQQDGFAQISNEKVTSIYQKRLVSLPEILNRYGYRTYFLASTEKHSTLNTMLKSMSFTQVYGMGDFDGYQDDRMTDKQTFAALRKLLLDQKQQPFFIGVYPSGTHHGRDSPDLKYNDGKNPYYNKFFNYDAQLGNFINFFDKSGFYKNTLLIITSDHSTFPTPEFKKSFGINADYFVDQIPLILHGANITHQKIDAHAYNSLSLTPTILQLLGVNNEPNYFLGCSLLDKYCSSQFSNMSAVGDSYYQTSSGKYPEYNVKELPENLYIKEFYNISG